MLFYLRYITVTPIKLRHYWFIVCLIIAWIASEGNQERKKDHTEPSLRECEERSIVLNTCEEQCECNNGKLTSCYRVRKEFTEMTIEERKRYINTYKLASVHPLFKKDYDKMVSLHLNAPDYLLHHTPEIFFPWHRWFLVQFENLLRRVDCRDCTLLGLEQSGPSLVERIENTGPLELGGHGFEGMETKLMISAWRTDLSARTKAYLRRVRRRMFKKEFQEIQFPRCWTRLQNFIPTAERFLPFWPNCSWRVSCSDS